MALARRQSIADLTSSLREDDLISIHAGDGNICKVQRTLLLNCSPWFEGALNKRFMEGQDRVLRFPGTPARTVEHFLYWLFNANIDPLESIDDKSTETEKRKAVGEAHLNYARLWIFGDKHLIPKLQNEAMTKLYKGLLKLGRPSLQVIREAYEGTCSGSLLRKFVHREVQSMLRCRSMSSGELESLRGVPGFFADVLSEYTAALNGRQLPKYADTSLEQLLVPC